MFFYELKKKSLSRYFFLVMYTNIVEGIFFLKNVPTKINAHPKQIIIIPQKTVPTPSR